MGIQKHATDYFGGAKPVFSSLLGIQMRCLLSVCLSCAHLHVCIPWQTAGKNAGAEKSYTGLSQALATASLNSRLSLFCWPPPAYPLGLWLGEAWGASSQGKNVESCTDTEMNILLPGGGGTSISESPASVKKHCGRCVATWKGDFPKQPARRGHLGGGLHHWAVPTTVSYPAVLFWAQPLVSFPGRVFCFLIFSLPSHVSANQ